MTEWIPLLMFVFTIGILMLGYPVAFSLSGSAIIFALIGVAFGFFDWGFFGAIPERLYGVMTGETLIAIPLFIFTGVILERSKISEDLLETMGQLFGKIRGGLGISICLVGALLAASTGIVGATVVSMGLLSLPVMLKYRYDRKIAAGVICASGTLGQIIPPSIILVILGDIISSANQMAQLNMGNFTPTAVSVGDLFVGAVIPGFLLVALYILYIVVLAIAKPRSVPSIVTADNQITGLELGVKVVKVLIPPLLLIMGVLGSILLGYATPTEAASVGGVGGLLLALANRQLNWKILSSVLESTAKINCMVFVILIGSSFFSLVFRGIGGDDVVSDFLSNLPGDGILAFLFVMLVIFVLGFFLDFFEICFIVIPIVGPILIQLGYDPIWLGVIIALNLQTSFLTPPFGFALFYLRGVAPPELKTSEIYQGVIPFILIQIAVILIVWYEPSLITGLPKWVFGS